MKRCLAVSMCDITHFLRVKTSTVSLVKCLLILYLLIDNVSVDVTRYDVHKYLHFCIDAEEENT